MYCAHCGARLPEGARFCIKCGAADAEGATTAGAANARAAVHAGVATTGEAASAGSVRPAGTQPVAYAATRTNARMQAYGPPPTTPTAPVVPTSPDQPASRVPSNRMPFVVAVTSLIVAVAALAFILIVRNGRSADWPGGGSSAGDYDYGTTVSTLTNGGYFARVGDKVYYVPDENISGMNGPIRSTIRCAKLDGTEDKLVLDVGEALGTAVNNINCLMVDASSNRLLFVVGKRGDRTHSVMAMPLVGPTATPTEIASFKPGDDTRSLMPYVQAYNGRLYFEDGGTLYSTSLDGSNRSRVADVHNANWWCVVDDYIFTQSDYKEIDRIPLEGGTPERVYTSSSTVNNVLVYADKLYFTSTTGPSNNTLTDFTRFDISTGEKTVLMHLEGSDNSFIQYLTADSLGLTVSLTRQGKPCDIYTCSLEDNSLTKVFTYEGVLAGEESALNVSSYDDAYFQIYAAIGDRVFFAPRKVDYSDREFGNGTSYDYEAFNDRAWITYCCVARDGSNFTVLGTAGKGPGASSSGD